MIDKPFKDRKVEHDEIFEKVISLISTLEK